MDKTALDLIGDVIGDMSYAVAVDEALGANGYVVVPRHLLDALAEAWNSDSGKGLSYAIIAVVEAVGPTREDTKP